MLLREFQENVSNLGLAHERLLLAVSGGRDSVVLEHLCRRAGYTYAISHCNFHLRGDESDRDEQFVRNLAQQSGCRLHVAQFDTATYASQHRQSIEEAARQLRYDFFEQVRAEHGYDYIIVAHHRDDSIETFFINLLRGTGIAGLHGIRPVNGRIVRPLLIFSRQQIDDYAAQHQLDYVDDSTNATDLYRRNAVRHRLIPLMRELNPAFDQAMQQTIDHLADTEQVYRQHLQHFFASITHTDTTGAISFLIDDLRQLQPRNTMCFELLHPYGFTSSQVEDMITSLDAPSGRRFLSATHLAVKDRNHLLIAERMAQSDTDDNGAEVMPYVSVERQEPPSVLATLRELTTSRCAFLDADRVQLPLRLRHWREGDRFQPYGMRGTQLLSDYFTDHKFSLIEKQRQLLLVDDADQILWIVGHRTSATAAVTAETVTMLRVTVQ